MLQNKVKKQITHAMEFLEKCQASDGLWRDYQLITGVSTSWVTAYVGKSLSPLLTQINGEAFPPEWYMKLDQMLEKAAQGLLQDRHPNRWAWGYHAELLPDSDSTAIALHFLSDRLAEGHPALIEASDYLQSLQAADGGIPTYDPKALPGHAYQGWTVPHLTVTMASLEAWSKIRSLSTTIQESIEDGINYFLHTYGKGELYEDYWWKGSFYPTYTVVSGLDHIDLLHLLEKDKLASKLNALRLQEGVWACRKEGADCFATSLALLSLLLLEERDHREYMKQWEDAIQWLLDQQAADGSFPASSYMRIPAPNKSIEEMDQELLDERVTVDVNGIFTTATVLAFLGKLISKESGDPYVNRLRGEKSKQGN